MYFPNEEDFMRYGHGVFGELQRQFFSEDKLDNKNYWILRRWNPYVVKRVAFQSDDYYSVEDINFLEWYLIANFYCVNSNSQLTDQMIYQWFGCMGHEIRPIGLFIRIFRVSEDFHKLHSIRSLCSSTDDLVEGKSWRDWQSTLHDVYC